jgi:hypothetical protein
MCSGFGALQLQHPSGFSSLSSWIDARLATASSNVAILPGWKGAVVSSSRREVTRDHECFSFPLHSVLRPDL